MAALISCTHTVAGVYMDIRDHGDFDRIRGRLQFFVQVIYKSILASFFILSAQDFLNVFFHVSYFYRILVTSRNYICTKCINLEIVIKHDV